MSIVVRATTPFRVTAVKPVYDVSGAGYWDGVWAGLAVGTIILGPLVWTMVGRGFVGAIMGKVQTRLF